MKKELLLASALVGTLGLTGAAQAATASTSGHTRVGVEWEDSDGSADATAAGHQQSSFSIAVSEMTDGGTTIATGFDLTDENDGATDNSGLTLTFQSDWKLDIVEAGSAYATHLATVPGGGGEQGIAGSSHVTAPSGLDYADSNDTVGFELHSADDIFGVEGLKGSVSASFNGDAAATSTAHAIENSFSIGASYVTTAGDSTVTIGGGMIQADSVASKGAPENQSTAFSISAVTGNLTIGAGYASGDYVSSTGANTDEDEQMRAVSVMTAGAKYVSGDMTFNVGYVNGEAKGAALGESQATKADTYSETDASVDLVVADGVTATVGYKDQARESAGTAMTGNSGTSWYIGANVSF